MRARVHRHLRAMLNYALEQKVIRVSPLATIRQDVPRHKPAPVRPLDEAEVQRLLRAACGSRLHALFVLAIDSGARQGELLALQWTDVDFDRSRVTIKRAASEVKGAMVIGPCKTDGSERTIDVSPSTIAALRRRKVLAVKEGLGACPWVFPSDRGYVQWKRNFVRNAWYPIRKAAGIPNARFHDVRHTCAVLLLRAGVHPKIVAERLGHSSIVVTLDVYSAWIPGMQAQAADAMGDLFRRIESRPKRLRVVA